jgi:hypothetical protein
VTPNSLASLNAICPYFTMFPLDFPLGVLSRRAKKGDRVLDPFCGRGTTNFAARLLGLNSLGVDSSAVATAITAAKLVTTTSHSVVSETRRILATREPSHVPRGEFWRWSYDRRVLRALCSLREALLHDCSTPPRIALRGILLGALHGPRQKTFQSYFSNQCPRTYAPKPAYALRYWKKHKLIPQPVDVIEVIARRASWYYGMTCKPLGAVRQADSRSREALKPPTSRARFDWVITSPPYYGMRTYIPDQWLRNWLVGGSDVIDYIHPEQVGHSSPESFAADLRRVWVNTAAYCADHARLVVRFGGITNRRVNPIDVVRDSLRESGWRIATLRNAGTAHAGKRQADSFLRTATQAVIEYDVWAVRH